MYPWAGTIKNKIFHTSHSLHLKKKFFFSSSKKRTSIPEKKNPRLKRQVLLIRFFFLNTHIHTYAQIVPSKNSHTLTLTHYLCTCLSRVEWEIKRSVRLDTSWEIVWKTLTQQKLILYEAFPRWRTLLELCVYAATDIYKKKMSVYMQR